MNFTESRRLPIVRLTGSNICLPFAGIQNRPAPAPEARQKVAHGGTVVGLPKEIQAPAGAAEIQPTNVSFAPSGALFICALIPTVSPWATFGRHSVAKDCRIPI
jgi:hypothetical protein